MEKNLSKGFMFPFFLTMPPFIVRITVVLAYAVIFPIVMVALAMNSPSLTAFLPLVFLTAFVVGYFYPTVEAYLRDSPNLVSIAVLNVFLGFTLLGWVAALVWATKSEGRAAGQPDTDTLSATNNSPTLPDTPKVEAAKTRACPFCAEEIMLAAVLCRFCKSDVSAKNVS